jgi:putative Holliday junction resolvase
VARASRRGGTLALDHGDKRTGFAYADALGLTTTPLEPFAGPGDSQALLERVAAVCGELDVGRFVVGMPLHADGSESARCAVVRAFVERLRARFPELEVVLIDEHLSSKAAEELLREAGFTSRESRARRDSWSALVLLRDWLASGQRSGGD